MVASRRKIRQPATSGSSDILVSRSITATNPLYAIAIPTGHAAERVAGNYGQPTVATGDDYMLKLFTNQRQEDRARIEALERRVEELRRTVYEGGSSDAVPLREISRDAAMSEIKAYFDTHHGDTIYASDIADALRLSYELVSDVINALEADGQIKES